MRALITCSLFVIALAWPRLAGAAILYHWIELGPDRQVSARAIVDGPDCPEILIDGQAQKMALRASPGDSMADATAFEFPVSVCELKIGAEVERAELNGEALPLPSAAPQRIAVIGDTGCRIKRHQIQACNNPRAWPLRAILDAVTRQRPDLVIHVGDFVYRDDPCPPGADCAGSPHGYGWASWRADWFDPAAPLMRQVPFLFLRGNHEDCRRGADGWFRFFGPRALPDSCPRYTAPWRIKLGDVDLVNFDSSYGDFWADPAARTAAYRGMANDAFSGLSGEAWFLTHRPVWAYMHNQFGPIRGDKALQDAFGAIFPREVTLTLTGHIHAFQALDMRDHPSQIIVGNSGTLLDGIPTARTGQVEIRGFVANASNSEAGFGFGLFERQADGGWRFSQFDEQGAVDLECRLSGRDMGCE